MGEGNNNESVSVGTGRLYRPSAHPKPCRHRGVCQHPPMGVRAQSAKHRAVRSDNGGMPAPTPPTQARNPLHGVTLLAMLEALVAAHGWAGLAQAVPVRCFAHDPSIKSSLTFLRKTPWAREKVEALYLRTLT